MTKQTICLALWLCGVLTACAAEQAAGGKPSSAEKIASAPRATPDPSHRFRDGLSRDDLYCDRDRDCEISTRFFECCMAFLRTEPYAMSRVAVRRYTERMKAECGGSCNPIGYPELCKTNPSDWTPACVGHVCSRRPAKPGTEPRPPCNDEGPSEPILPGVPPQ